MEKITEEEHILDLSRTLLDDIELSRLPADKLLFKCSRLARLSGTDEIKGWISHEMMGYNSKEELSILYMGVTGRWTKRSENKGFWSPLAQIEAQIQASQVSLSSNNLVPIERTRHANNISRLSGIRSRVLSLLHIFVSQVYYERQFADLAKTVFEGYKIKVDVLIAEKAGSVLEKLPAVVARLQEDHPESEAVSQALATCRRIIESFADSVYPPSEEEVNVGGTSLRMGSSNHLNRLNAYIAANTDSESRRQKLRQNIRNLYDRVSAGVHDNVTAEEAYALFLNIYLVLGEVLTLSGKHVETE